MNAAEVKKLDTIIAKIEALENQISSTEARSRLRTAKDELLRLYNEQRR